MKRVLVVDDEYPFLELVQAILQSSEVAVDTADSFATAIELLDKKNFDVVITDNWLSNERNKSGLEILRYARQKLPGARKIFLTGFAYSELISKAYSFGADVILEKPISMDLLRNIIAKPD